MFEDSFEDIEGELEKTRLKKGHDLEDLNRKDLKSRDMDEIFCEWE